MHCSYVFLAVTHQYVCDKSKNTWVCAKWQWKVIDWWYWIALPASSVVQSSNTVLCVSLSFHTHPCVLAIEFSMWSGTVKLLPSFHIWNWLLQNVGHFVQPVCVDAKFGIWAGVGLTQSPFLIQLPYMETIASFTSGNSGNAYHTILGCCGNCSSTAVLVPLLFGEAIGDIYPHSVPEYHVWW